MSLVISGMLPGRIEAFCPDDAITRDLMPARSIPERHWRSYGDDKLPTPAEALSEPFAAFPSWFMRIECDRCGKVRMINETHTAQRDMLIRDIIAKMRHDGWQGREGGTDHRHRGRVQPPGAEDRAADWRGLSRRGG